MYAIFYKEWIKTRWYFLLAVLATLGFTSYCMLRINRVVEMKGAAHVWEVMLQRDVIFIDMLQYIPLIAGIPDGNRAVCPRDATQMFETDSPSALSGTKNDGQYVTLRTHIDSCLFCF